METIENLETSQLIAYKQDALIPTNYEATFLIPKKEEYDEIEDFFKFFKIKNQNGIGTISTISESGEEKESEKKYLQDFMSKSSGKIISIMKKKAQDGELEKGEDGEVHIWQKVKIPVSVDINGNPIPKLDEKGLPIFDKDGKPVFEKIIEERMVRYGLDGQIAEQMSIRDFKKEREKPKMSELDLNALTGIQKLRLWSGYDKLDNKLDLMNILFPKKEEKQVSSEKKEYERSGRYDSYLKTFDDSSKFHTADLKNKPEDVKEFKAKPVDSLQDFIQKSAQCKTVEEYKKFYEEHIADLEPVTTKIENNEVKFLDKNNEPFKTENFKDNKDKADFYSKISNEKILPNGDIDLHIPKPDNQLLQDIGTSVLEKNKKNFYDLKTVEGQNKIEKDVQNFLKEATSIENTPTKTKSVQEVWRDFLKTDFDKDNQEIWNMEGRELPTIYYGKMPNGELLQGWTIEKNKTATEGAIYLSKIDENGEVKKMQIPSELLKNAIKAHEKLVDELEVANSKEKTQKAFDNFSIATGVNADKPRLNTVENFTHNFALRCKQSNAKSEIEALKIANEIVNTMTPTEKNKMVELKKSFKKEKGMSFETKLTNDYKEIAKQRGEIDTEHLKMDDFSEKWDKVIKKQGEDIDPSGKLKIGDTLKLALNVSNPNEKSKTWIPAQPLTIVKATGTEVMLQNSDKSSVYILPKNQFVKDSLKIIKQQEKRMEKNQKIETKETTKENKKQNIKVQLDQSLER